MLKENQPLLDDLLGIEDPDIFWNKYTLLPRQQVSDLLTDDRFVDKVTTWYKKYLEIANKYSEQAANTCKTDGFDEYLRNKNSEVKWYDDTKDTKRFD